MQWSCKLGFPVVSKMMDVEPQSSCLVPGQVLIWQGCRILPVLLVIPDRLTLVWLENEFNIKLMSSLITYSAFDDN